jgi:hypothetical protein
VRANLIVTVAVLTGCYAAVLGLTYRHVAARTPGGIVRRLLRSGEPVTVRVNPLNSTAWDPSRGIGRGGFYAPGTATYGLVDTTTVRVRFEPRSGRAVERTGPIPDFLLPEAPETRHRRRIARVVMAAYLLVGLVAFAVSLAVIGGSSEYRARAAALIACGCVAAAWLVAHVVLTRAGRGQRQAAPKVSGPRFAQLRRVAMWLTSLVVISAALGVAWRLDSLDQPHPTPWTTACFEAGAFVFLCAAVLAASLHHHNYVHHNDHHARASGG